MRLYLATLDSRDRVGLRAKVVIHAHSVRQAKSVARSDFPKWKVADIEHIPGLRCILIKEESAPPSGVV